MPHYADGTEARIGDNVVGVLFNSGPSPKAGVIISITPGTETCNAMVQFTEVLPVDAPVPRMAIFFTHGDAVTADPMARMVKGERHGTDGAEYMAYTCADYCETGKLTNVG